MEIYEESPTYYAIIPANVRYDNELSDREKLLYGEITALCNKTGECWASNEYFSKLYNITTRSIRTSISNLVKKGYLERKVFYKKGSKEIEKRVLTLGKNSSLPLGKILPNPQEKFFPDNNININNTSINNICTKNDIGTSFEHLEERFEEFWKLYPRKISKAKAKLRFQSALKKTSSDVILQGVKNYLKEIEIKKTDEQYIAHPATWLNQERWNDEYQRISDSPPISSAKRTDNEWLTPEQLEKVQNYIKEQERITGERVWNIPESVWKK